MKTKNKKEQTSQSYKVFVIELKNDISDKGLLDLTTQTLEKHNGAHSTDLLISSGQNIKKHIRCLKQSQTIDKY